VGARSCDIEWLDASDQRMHECTVYNHRHGRAALHVILRALTDGTSLAFAPGCHSRERSLTMLWTIFVILLILWLLGMVSGSTFGGFIHLLLVVAIVVVLIRVIQGRRPI
jgi:hypothetical protein